VIVPAGAILPPAPLRLEAVCLEQLAVLLAGLGLAQVLLHLLLIDASLWPCDEIATIMDAKRTSLLYSSSEPEPSSLSSLLLPSLSYTARLPAPLLLLVLAGAPSSSSSFSSSSDPGSSSLPVCGLLCVGWIGGRLE
jgi:hypothetical protein